MRLGAGADSSGELKDSRPARSGRGPKIWEGGETKDTAQGEGGGGDMKRRGGTKARSD